MNENLVTAHHSGEIMVVDDTPDSLKLITSLLMSAGYRVRPANDPVLGLESALDTPPDLILLDIRMPVMDGFEVCRRLKSDLRTSDVPILFVSASSDVEDQVRGFHVGGVDYITKPIRREEVLARVQAHLELSKIKLKLESLVEQRTDELRKSEAMFRGVFENASVGVVYLDAKREVVLSNKYFQELMGYELSFLKGRALVDTIYEEDRERLLGYLDNMSGGDDDAVQFEIRLQPTDARLLWANIFVGALRDEEKRITGFSIVIEDITIQKQMFHERDRVEKNLRDSRERLRSLSTHLQDVREEEKARIAREIHDEFGGTLAAIKLDTVWLKKKIGEESREYAVKLDNMVDGLNGMISSTRRIVTELRPSLLYDLGLWPAIEWQAKEFEKRTGIKCLLQNGGDDDMNECAAVELDEQVALTLYRIVQESLTNINRHASATVVNMKCLIRDGMVTMTIQDNGVGIDKTLVKKPGSHGIRGMYERVGSLGGYIHIDSKKNSGTTIEVSLPMGEDADNE